MFEINIVDKKLPYDILEIAEAKILQLWKVIVTATFFIAGILVVSRPVSISTPIKTSQAQDLSDIQLSNRNVLPRNSRNVTEIETYYGKPGIFSLSDMLMSQEVTVYPEDIVETFPEPSFGIGSQIRIFRALPVIVFDGTEKKIYRTWQKNISEFLAEKRIEIGDKDIISPSIETGLTKDLEIRITRVSETQIREKISIDFKTIKKEDPNLERGKSYTVQAGKRGSRERLYQVRRENSVEVSRVLLEEKIIEQPQDQIIAYGTKKTITVRCRYNDWVMQAVSKYDLDPNNLCTLMMRESNGNRNSIGFWGESTYGLFQYKIGFWNFASARAGFPGAAWNDPYAQIFTTAWAWANGHRNRWP